MSKSVVDEIEAELKQVSPWPWTYDERVGCIAIYEHGQLFNCLDIPKSEFIAYWSGYNDEITGMPRTHANDRSNAAFFAKSPERLAALCQAIRAYETYLNDLRVCGFIGDLDHGAFQGWKSVDSLQSARRELKLTDQK